MEKSYPHAGYNPAQSLTALLYSVTQHWAVTLRFITLIAATIWLPVIAITLILLRGSGVELTACVGGATGIASGVVARRASAQSRRRRYR